MDNTFNPFIIPKMEGYIISQVFKRGKAWSARIQWADDDGKRCSKSQSAFPTKALANEWVIEQKAQLNKGVQIDKEISFVDYYEQWFNTYKKEKLADITINRYVYGRL